MILRYFLTTCILTIVLLFASTTTLHAQPLLGDYTINAAMATGGNNFASFNDFAAALEAEGVAGNVTAHVTPESGPYEEQVVFSNIAGTGPDAVVAINGNGETLTALTDTGNRHLLRLSGVSYFSVFGLMLERNVAASSGFYGIHVFGSGSHITIAGCHAEMSGTTSTLVGGFICSGSETSILEAGDFHDISILNNSANGGGYGASVYGQVGNLSTNILIDGNNFENFNSNGVYLRETDGAVVSNNYFDRNAGTVSSCNAIQLAQSANINGNVFNNTIEHTQTGNGTMTFRGVYVFGGTGHTVYNNVVQNILLESGDVVGIEVRDGAPDLYFNTISIDHSTPSTGDLVGIEENLSNTGMTLRNNNISITQTTSGNSAALVLGNLTNLSTGIDSDYNNFYVPNGFTAIQGLFSPTFFPTLANWQASSTQDANSFAIDPQFQAFALTLPTNATMDNLGIALPGYDTDILGITRNDPPDVGAYEFGACEEPPAAVPEIFGPLEVCAGDLAVGYSVNDQPDANNYIWDTDVDSEFFYGFVSTGIIVNFGDSTTTITVTPENDCGLGESTSIVVTVNPLPEVTLDLPDQVCEDGGPIALTGGQPAGGTYSGEAVDTGQFFPGEAGPGVHGVTYEYVDANGCFGTIGGTITVVSCTGLSENTNEVNWQIAPNPSPDRAQIVLQSSHSGNLEMRMFDTSGKQVWRNNTAITGGEQRIDLPVELLSAGIYLVQLNHDAFSVTERFIKTR